MQRLDDFTQAYVDCALWSTLDDNEEPLDGNWDTSDIHPDSLDRIRDVCAEFQREYEGPIGYRSARAGRDFWLTRNGHGAGFWDGDWPEVAGEALTAAAHKYGESDVYVGDDGYLHFT